MHATFCGMLQFCYCCSASEIIETTIPHFLSVLKASVFFNLFFYVAPFRHQAFQRALQEHRNAFKIRHQGITLTQYQSCSHSTLVYLWMIPCATWSVKGAECWFPLESVMTATEHTVRGWCYNVLSSPLKQPHTWILLEIKFHTPRLD